MSIDEVQRELEFAQQNLEHYRALAELPSLSPRAAQQAREAARSYQAAVILGQKALAYEQEKAQAHQDQRSDTAVPPTTAEQAPMSFDKALARLANVCAGSIAVVHHGLEAIGSQIAIVAKLVLVAILFFAPLFAVVFGSLVAGVEVAGLVGGGDFVGFLLFFVFVGVIGVYVSPHVQPQISKAIMALLDHNFL